MTLAGLVIQSHTTPLPQAWLADCAHSVQSWAQGNALEYRWLDDEIFLLMDPILREKFGQRRVIASDLARLLALRQALEQGYDPVIWADCDFHIFAPQHFTLPRQSYAVGREVWIQQDPKGRLKAYRRVHNAFLLFRANNAFLDFYIETATRLLQRVTGPVPPQFIGPKLLAALDNICQLPVMENAAMISPLVLRDIAGESGPALDLFISTSTWVPAGANLCASLVGDGSEDNALVATALEHLTGGLLAEVK